MATELLAITFDFIGKVLLGITVLLVHKRVIKEHKINKKVLREMKFEQAIGILAILFIVVDYLLHLKIL